MLFQLIRTIEHTTKKKLKIKQTQKITASQYGIHMCMRGLRQYQSVAYIITLFNKQITYYNAHAHVS